MAFGGAGESWTAFHGGVEVSWHPRARDMEQRYTPAKVAQAKWRAQEIFVRVLARETGAVRDLFARCPVSPIDLLKGVEDRENKRQSFPITEAMVDRLHRLFQKAG